MQGLDSQSVNALILIVLLFLIILLVSACAVDIFVHDYPQVSEAGHACLCILVILLVPLFSFCLTDYTFGIKRQHRVQARQRQSPEFSVDNVVIKNIDVTAGNNLSPALSFTLHANNRYKSRGIYYAAAEAKLSFYYYADGNGHASLIRPSRWYYLDIGTLAFAAMSAAPVNLPPGNNVPAGGIAFSAESKNVTLTDEQALFLIEYKENLDMLDAFLTVRALVKNDISDARSRLLEVNCGSLSLVPNSTQVFTCS